MAKKILIGNYKGGVGKTTSVINISAVLSRKEKVLMLDLDPQSSLSELCILKTKFENKSITLDSIDLVRELEEVNILGAMKICVQKLKGDY